MELTQHPQSSPTCERFIVEADLPRSTASHDIHPRLVRELTRNELRILTQILHLDNTAVMTSSQQAEMQQLLQELPKRLRRRQLSPSLKRKKGPGAICNLHRALNADVIGNILHLVQREVTTHFRQLDAYPELVGPIEAQILSNLRTLKGMWTSPARDNPVAPGAWPYQINGCPACILARIASNKDALRDLRVVLQSRTRTRKKHRPCQLMAFIDECINHFGSDDVAELFGTASQLAFSMKDTRKSCVKRRLRDTSSPRRKHHCRDPGQAARPDGQLVSGISTARPSKDTLRLPSISSQNLDNSASNTKRGWFDAVFNSSRTSVSSNRDIEGSKLSEISNSDVPKPQYNLNRPSRHQSQWRDCPFGNLPDEIDELIDMYKRLGNGNPYSHDEFVPDAMIAPLRIRKNEPLPQLSDRDSEIVPLVYEYSESDYFTSDWTDDSCDEETSQAQPARSSPAATTWSLVCNQGNVI